MSKGLSFSTHGCRASGIALQEAGEISLTDGFGSREVVDGEQFLAN